MKKKKKAAAYGPYMRIDYACTLCIVCVCVCVCNWSVYHLKCTMCITFVQYKRNSINTIECVKFIYKSGTANI